MSDTATILSHSRMSFPSNRISGATIVERDEISLLQDREYRHSTPSRWFFDVLDEIKLLTELDRGWDSHDANPPEWPNVAGAIDLAACLAQLEWTRPTVVTATRNGGIQFEWGRHDAVYFELECTARDTAQFYFSDQRLGLEFDGTLVQGDSLEEVLTFILRAKQCY